MSSPQFPHCLTATLKNCCRQDNVPTVFFPQFVHCLTATFKNYCRQNNVPTVFSPQFLHCLTASLKNCCRQDNVSTVFSPQFLHCLTTSLKNRDSLLFEQAQRCVRRIADLAKLSSVDTQTKVSPRGSLCPCLLRQKFRLKFGREPRCCTQNMPVKS